jgi:hypothetical protein
MDQDPSVQAIRAIASVMIKRYIALPLIVISSLGITGTVVSIILTIKHSGWWVLVAGIVLFWTLLGTSLSAVSLRIAKKIQPRALSQKEKRQINNFVSSFGANYAASSGFKKSPIIISARIAWNYVKNRDKKRMNDILLDPVQDIKNIGKEFKNLTELFN